eukprot:915309-Alexandrium_andersonii.AAC.1
MPCLRICTLPSIPEAVPDDAEDTGATYDNPSIDIVAAIDSDIDTDIFGDGHPPSLTDAAPGEGELVELFSAEVHGWFKFPMHSREGMEGVFWRRGVSKHEG